VVSFSGRTTAFRENLFVNVTNLSETVDREVTRIWVEADPKIYVENPRRPLPKRLKPQETWETWIDLWQLPRGLIYDDLPTLVRARLSIGEVLGGVRNESIPDSGWIPGESITENLARETVETHDPPPPPNRPWWRLW
jgi:hypothetical protein